MADKIYGNRWKIVEPLSEGGQGHIFKVIDIHNSDNRYVLKRLKNINRIERFKIEIEAVRTLNHPNISNLIDCEVEGPTPFFVSDYCAGGEMTFDKVSRLSPVEKLALFSTICKSVGYAHDKGVIHRDIKPPNIVLREDGKTPVITDFGLCFNTDEGLERLTELIEQAGSRYYMPPELADGRAESVTPASDVYSLGKLLYWMFKGEIFDREEANGEQKYRLQRWDLRQIPEYFDSIHFIYDILDQTVVEDPIRRLANGNQLASMVDKLISILENDGRYLDADLPSKCIFCGKGKYSGKVIVPTIRKNSPPFFQGYDLLYHNPFGIKFDAPINHLPDGSLGHTSYPIYLMLACNHCGNLQIFSIQNSKVWKNVNPVMTL